MKKDFEDHVKGKETRFFIHRHLCKDNSYKWFEWHAKANSEGTELYAVARDITARKNTEQALRNSEEKYAAAFSTSPDAININSLDGKYVEINTRFTELTGYTKEDVLSIANLEIDIWAIPEDRVKLVEGLKKDGVVKDLESVFRCKDGTLITALLSATLFQINQETFMLSVSRDITQRKRIEQALSESESKYRLLAVNSSDIIWTINLEGQFTYISPSVETARGFTPEEVMAHGIDGTLTPDSAIIAKQALAETVQILQSGQTVSPRTFILEHSCKDGSTVWAELTVSTMFDDNQQLKGFLGISHNVIERLQTEEKLKQSEEIFRSLAEYSTNMIFIVIKNKIYYVNKLCEKKLGYTKEELYAPDFDFLKLISPEHQDWVKNNILQKLPGKEPQPYELRMTSKDGRPIYTMVDTKFIQIDKEDAILGVILDISEQRWAEELLRKKANQFEHIAGETWRRTAVSTV
jgi:PAS domain S-box-containing protein